MDVNVKDVDEIVRFGRSLQGFLSDYLGVLNLVMQGANSDESTARNNLNTIRNYVDSAERAVRSAEQMLESAENKADNDPEGDYSSDIEYAERILEERQAAYERAKQALEEAEGIVQRVKTNADMVVEEVTRSRRQIQDNGRDALQSIQKAARAISQYVRK